MSRLKIYLRGTQISDFNLDQQREYVGGRKEGCDIKLQPEKGISREHFKIKFENDQWLLQSLSRFGEIYSNGQRIESIALTHGSKFLILPYEFEFSSLEQSEFASVNQNSSEEIDQDEKTVVGILQQVPYVKLMTVDGQVREMLRLELGEIWTAGRDPSCQIVIPDNRVSRRQFEIRKINGQYSAIDLASVNGTFINGVPLSSTEPKFLKSGDAITVLDNTIYFELHDPNFLNKIENIEIPVNVQSTNYASEVNDENFQFNPEIDGVVEDYSTDNQPQFDQSINQQIPDLNSQNSNYLSASNFQSQNSYLGSDQFYTQNSNQTPHENDNSKLNFKKIFDNKPLFISIIILSLTLIYFGYEALNLNQTPVPTQAEQPIKSDNPFDNLTSEQKEQVVRYYNTAEKALTQLQFSIAKENLDKLHVILPKGYERSLELDVQAMNGELTLKAQQELEQKQKMEEENKKTIADTLLKCEKMIDATVTVEKMNECLGPVSLLDPQNSEKEKLINQVQTMLNETRIKEEQKKKYDEQVVQMNELFIKAEKMNETGYPKKTIKAYQLVIDSELPDPKKYKKIAESRIKVIREKIEERNKTNILNAETFLKEGKLKEGIIALREALLTDPESAILRDKIIRYSNELRNQTKLLYQEAIIDENFGNVEGSDNKLGAKDKWKKIISLDLADGEYYRKAYIKLRRYGVF